MPNRELSRLLNEVNGSVFTEPSKITVAEFLDRWMRDYAAAHVSGKTLERYQQVVAGHLKPALGALPLQKLLPVHILDHYSKAMRDGARKDGREGGLWARTVNHHHRIPSESLKHAVGGS